MKILLIEDSPVDQGYVKELVARFRGGSPDVVVADRVGTALPHFTDDQIGVILLDLNLPDSRGLETFRTVHRLAGHIPIIILTGVEDDALALEAVEKGAQDYLNKGQVGVQDLQKAIRYAIERHRILSELKQTALRLTKEEEALKDSQRQLQISETMYRTLFMTVGAATAILDEEGKIILANTEVEPLFGFPPEELEGAVHWSRFVPPDELPRLAEYWRLLHEDPAMSSQKYESRLVDRWGRIKYGLLSVRLIPGTRNCIVSIADITERRRSEGALQESEVRFRELFDRMGNGVIVLQAVEDGRNFIIQDINRAAEKMEGVLKAEVFGRRVTQVLPSVGGTELLTVLRRVWETSAPEYLLSSSPRSGSDTVSWRENWAYKLPSGDMVVVSNDITERREMEESILRRENTLKTVLNAPVDLMGLVDTGGTVLAMNETGLRIMGRKAGEVIGKMVEDLFPPEIARNRMAYLTRVVETGEPAEFGDERGGRYFQNRMYPVFNPQDNRVEQVAIFASDITERRRAEMALRESEEHQRLLLEYSGLGIAYWDYHGTLLFLNRKAAENMGGSVAEFTGKRMDELFPPEAAAEYLTRIALMRDEKGKKEYEDLVPMKGGDRWFLSTFTNVMDGNGKPHGVQIISQDLTERKQMEQALQESEERYRTVVESQTELITRFDPSFRVTFVNDAYCTYFGIRRDEIIGKHFRPLIPEEDRELVKRHFASLSREAPVGIIEHRILMPGGQLKWQKWVDTAIFNENGVLTEYQSVGRDTTERRNAEEALKNAKKYAENLIKTASTMVVTLDGRGNITNFNPAAEKITGYSLPELQGRNWFEVLVPKDRYPEVWKEFTRLMAGGLPGEFENPILTRSGEERYISWQNSEIRESGEITGTLSFGLDITERKRAEQALRESEEKYRSLVERAADGIAILQDGIVRYVNQNQARYWGGSPEEIISRPFTDFVHPGERAKLLEQYRKRISGEKVEPVYETVLQRKNGTSFPAELSAGLISYRGRPADLVLIRDITERKRAEEALRESEARLKAVVDGSPIPQFVIGKDHRVLYWNRALEELSGIQARDIVGTAGQWKPFYREKRPVLADLVVDRDPRQIQELYGSKVRPSKFIEGAYEALDFFPTLREGSGWLYFTAAPVRDAGGSVIGAVETLEDITERKRAEEALRQSEERFKTLFEDSAVPQILMDNGVVIDCNAAFLSLFALEDKGTVLGHSPDDFAPEVQPDGVSSHARGDGILRDVLEKGTARLEWAHLKHDAARTPILCDVNLNVITIDGKPLIHAVILDITEQKRAEEALRESEEKYRDLAEASRDFIYIIDDRDTIAYVNTQAAEFLGKRVDELVGKPRALFFPAEADVAMKKGFDRVFSTGEVYCAENPIPSPAGTTWQDTTLTPLRDHEGKITRVMGISRDISGRKRIEEALRESEEKYRNLVERANDGIVVIHEGAIIFCNRRIGDFWGGDITEIQGKPMMEFVAPSERERTGEFYLRAMSGGPLPDRFETILLRKDGSSYPAELTPGIITYQGKPAALVIIRDITERKKVEEALKSSEVYLKTIFNSVRTGLLLIDPETHVITDANPAVAKMFGTDVEAMIGSECHRVICPADKGKCPITDLGQQVDNSERVFLRADGTKVPILKTVAPVTVAGRQYLLESFIDITEVKRAAQALQESEERYRTVIETANEAIVVAQDGILKFVNPRAVEMLESTPEYIGSVPFAEFIHPEDREMVVGRYTRRIAGENIPSNYDFRFIGKKGRVTWVHISAVRITWNGRPATLNFLMDVSERRKMEQALKDSEEMFRNPVEQSPVGVYLFQDGAVRYTNPRLSEIFGYPHEEAKTLPFDRVIHPDDLPMVREEIARWMRGEAGPKTLSFRGLKKDGTPVDLEIYSSNMLYQGRPGTYGTVIDVTERKRLEIQIRESLREKEVLLKEIHHRVKNNMQVISSLLSVQSQNIKDETVRGLFKESQNRIRSIALVHELLYRSDKLDQIEYGAYLKKMFVPLFESYSIDQRKVAMAIDAHDTMITIEKAVPCSLIVNELISNSLKHAFPGDRRGEIRVGFRVEDGRYILDYRDNGIGIPPALDVKTCTTLGMKLVHGLTRQLQGTIDVENEGGVHFLIAFPADARHGGGA